MIIKFSQVRLIIISLLVIILPLVQNQWLNLYLFDVNNFTNYKLLYFLSGSICPIFVCINSLSKFTYYKFKKNTLQNNDGIKGRILLFSTTIILILNSYLISNYIFSNLKIFYNLFNNNNKYFSYIEIEKQIFVVATISIILLFKKLKIVIKKIILINYFITSMIIWYSNINNISLDGLFLINNLIRFENVNFINILFLLSIELTYYFWSYFSYNTNLSDWNVPIIYKNEITPIFYIIFFYLLIIVYYSILYR